MLGRLLKWSLLGKIVAWARSRRGRHEVECPRCGATIRARMADRKEPLL